MNDVRAPHSLRLRILNVFLADFHQCEPLFAKQNRRIPQRTNTKACNSGNQNWPKVNRIHTGVFNRLSNMLRYYHSMKIILSVLLCGAVLLGLFFLVQRPVTTSFDTSAAESVLQTPTATIRIIRADTEQTREHGLSDRENLPTDTGMLFIFPNVGIQGFWMKDMHFPLDIIWIDEHKKVIGIASKATPESYPEVFMSPKPIQYVLEINAGKSADFGITTGTQLVF
jgi:uncharacterized membrane protein (UPF0127 family)